MGKVIIRDEVWKTILSKVKTLDHLRVKVGILGGKGAEEQAGETNLATVALANEFGTEDGHVPERSYMRSTLAEKHEEVAKMQAEAAKKIISEGGDLRRELGRIGAYVASQIKEKIRSSVPPPNAPSTIRRKTKDPNATADDVTTLVNTGRLVNAVTWDVVNKEGDE